MKKSNRIKTPEELERIVDQIVDNFHPRKIILFGSYAYGRPNRDSDVDLLIVMESKERPARLSGKISAAIKHPFPIDILVKTPQQIERRLAIGDPVVKEATSKGMVLYDAAN